MSSFFNNEEQKMKAYKANLKKEAVNQFKQGEKLQDYLLYQKGIETQETGLNKFAEAIGQKVGENVNVVGKVNKLKKAEALPYPNATVDEFGVSIKNRNKGPKSIKQPPKPKPMKSINTDLEKENMGMEDVNTNTLMKGIKPSSLSSDDVNKQREAQAKLDLIALFQQDVKESRKRQAEKDLAALNATEDARIRQVFMQVLDDMMDEVNLKESKARSKKKYEEEKMLIDKIQNLIENQRMHDSFMEFSALAVKNEFAKKIQRNLKAAFENKKFMKSVKDANAVNSTMNNLVAQVEQKASYKPYENEMQRRNELMNNTRNKAATTIQKRMAELRALKAEKKRSMSVSTEATDLGSIAGLSNRGRPPTENLASKRLAKFQELEAMQNKEPKQVKQMKNLRAQLFLKPMAMEDKPEHRPTRGSNLRK
jgi:hypothetical protein